MTARQALVASLWAAECTQRAIGIEILPPASRAAVSVMLQALRRRGYRVRVATRKSRLGEDVVSAVAEALRMDVPIGEIADTLGASRHQVAGIRDGLRREALHV